jgi:hypothetical protein
MITVPSIMFCDNTEKVLNSVTTNFERETKSRIMRWHVKCTQNFSQKIWREDAIWETKASMERRVLYSTAEDAGQ